MPRVTKNKKITKTNKKISLAEKKESAVKSIKEKINYISTTGKRKSAVAQIRFNLTGNKEIIINKKDYKKYFPYFIWQEIVESPLKAVDFKNYQIQIKVAGGGVKAQAESIKLGIARAIVEANQELRKILKPKGFLSRDSRIKERKKPGLKRARRAPQWKKR
ncbi:MAG: 30S ribosomal protein S9 [Ignavibacterium sp.]|nr:30S ribosomal protein S9 [Ignavibacterium sp.]